MAEGRKRKVKQETKYVELFLEEAGEQLDSLNQVLLRLESDPDDTEAVNEAFRLVHTLKGTANLIGLDPIGELAHSMEDVLDGIRSSGALPGQKIIDILFESADLLRVMMGEVRKDGEVRTGGSELSARLDRAAGAALSADDTKRREQPGKKCTLSLDDDEAVAFMEAKKDGRNIFFVTFGVSESSALKEGRIFQVRRALEGIGTVLAAAPDAGSIAGHEGSVTILISTTRDRTTVENCVLPVHELEDIHVKPIGSLLELDTATKETPGMEGDQGLFKMDTVRVKSRYLDQLLDLVGELMISENRVRELTDATRGKELEHSLKDNDRLIGELQNSVLMMRMVPLEYIFNKFPRMVRDMVHDTGKEVDFRMIGNDIEIDRSLLDDVGDTLMHLLRNSVDHGLEIVEERADSDKERKGSLLLKAYSEGNNVVIEVMDDGRGIDTQSVVSTAVSRGLISEEEGDKLDERGRTELVFLPGLSTAREVSETSGRGVGLDVVNEKIMNLGGTVRMETEPGRGTTVVIRLPPSMAIIRAMLVQVENEKYAIPLENVVEMVNIGKGTVHNVVDTGIIQLRDEVLPIMDLNEKFGEGATRVPDDNLPVVIVQKDKVKAGLVVSRLLEQREIVIKNIGGHMRQARHFSGATILGDGRVAMILNVGAFI